MIRIDEIYNNTFWPWARDNLQGVRIQHCDPFGRSDPDSVIGYGRDDIPEHNYIFFFDQEPIHLNIHLPTFKKVVELNTDIHRNCHYDRDNGKYQRISRPHDFIAPGYIVTSERDSDTVEYVCQQFQWQSLYYFFHGWAALDWYRGYDRTFLIKPWQDRRPQKTFIAPNRIIAGERQHRLEVLYYILKNGMTDNHISCPAVCPAENINILDAVRPLSLQYPDIESVFAAQQLPINFAGETAHPMHSCWLSLFEESADSLLYLVTETVARGRRHHLTEKTFKPIALGMPFMLVGTRGSLQYLRSYGFRTFDGIWDESYDDADDDTRIARMMSTLRSLNELSPAARQDLFAMCWPVIEHNWNHFYGGGFEQLLWQELRQMLNGIKSSL